MHTFRSDRRKDTASIDDNMKEELSKISDRLDVNKLSFNILEPKFIQIHHN